MIFVTVGAQMAFDRLIRAVDAWAGVHPAVSVFGQIGHRVKLDRTGVGDGKGVGDGAPASPAAPDQRQADRIVLGGVDERRAEARKQRARGGRAAQLQHLAAGRRLTMTLDPGESARHGIAPFARGGRKEVGKPQPLY